MEREMEQISLGKRRWKLEQIFEFLHLLEEQEDFIYFERICFNVGEMGEVFFWRKKGGSVEMPREFDGLIEDSLQRERLSKLKDNK